MYSYVAFLWNASSHESHEGASLLVRRLQSGPRLWTLDTNAPGIQVWSTDRRAYSPKTRTIWGPTHEPTGVLLGTLFHRADSGSDSPPTALEPTAYESQRIAMSHGRWLVDYCWGDYVAIIWSPDRPEVVVVKDPAGSLPCFITTTLGITVIFSRVSDWMTVAPSPPTVNWAYVRERVVRNDLDSGIDSLLELRQVRRGECVKLVRGAAVPMARLYYWTPFAFTGSDQSIDSAKTAITSLRSAVLGSTLAWASCHQSILHRLSGGLDSSVILGCLSVSPNRPVITAHTYFNPDGRSDERPWAALAAGHCRCTHRESPVDPKRSSLRGLETLLPSNEPLSMLFGHLNIEPLEREIASEIQATALFTGDGGDAVFGRLAAGFAADDYIQRYGRDLGMVRAAYQVALYKDLTTWAVLRSCLRRRLLQANHRDQRALLAHNTVLVNPELRESWLLGNKVPHPWFGSHSGASWTQMFLLAGLLIPPESYGAFVDLHVSEPETIYPLQSQPVIELCLRIPTYLQLDGGLDRALVRSAFAPELPHAIRCRSWKDSVPAFFENVIHQNLEFLRQFLLDGLLVRERILVRDSVESALSGKPSKQHASCVEILLHVATEHWVRYWTNDHQSREGTLEPPCAPSSQ